MANKGSKKRRLSITDDDEDDPHISSKKTPVSKHGPNGLRSPSFSFTPHNKPAELYRKDLISAMKLADSEQLQNEDYLLIADSWRQDWERGVQVPVNDLAIINEPKVKEIREKSKTGDFKIPRKLLHAAQDETYKQGFHELTGMNQLSEQVVRYDLDDLDVCWLETINMEREEMSLSLIHEWIMERIFEELETQCHKGMNDMIKSEEGFGIEYDEDVVCDVCRSPDSEDGNEMVFCDNCDICVHQACYGIQTIPEGSYLCRACALGVKPTCLLCPNVKGAMKSTRSGTKWAHVSCSIWIPEVSIGCVEKMEPITKISLIPASRWTLVCCLCKERYGACIQCSVKTCKTAFHVTCGFNNGMDMKTILDPAEKDGVKLRAYCPKHTQNGGQIECESPSSPKSPKSPRSPRSPRKDGSPRKEMSKEEVAELRKAKTKEIEEDFSRFVNTEEAAKTLQVDEDIVDIVKAYWKLKRMANFNRPLLMPKTEEADRLEKQQEDSLVARMKMFVHLRQDLERVRNLCYMVNRREKMKRQVIKIQEKVFLAANAYLTDSKHNLSSREIQKTVKKYKKDNVYLATNLTSLVSLPSLTPSIDLDSMTTDDDSHSDHSGPTFNSPRRFKPRQLSGLEKLDMEPSSSVCMRTELSDNDVDIEADEPPVLEMEDISNQRRNLRITSKERHERAYSKGKSPMPDLLPETKPDRTIKVKGANKRTKPLNLDIYDFDSKSNDSSVEESNLARRPIKIKSPVEKQTRHFADCLHAEISILKPKSPSPDKSGKSFIDPVKLVIKSEAISETNSETNSESVKTKPVKIKKEKFRKHRKSIEKTRGRPPKHELMALLTKQNLRISDDIKDMVQNKILKKRGMLKQINGLLDKNQPKLEVYFSKCNSSVNSPSRSSSRLNIKNMVNNSKLIDTTPEKSNKNNSGSNVESDLYCLMQSPETRSYKRRLESGFNSNVKKNIFNTSVSSKLIPSENYSAIPTMLISPGCLSLKHSLKETINNSHNYRSHSPASSESSSLDSKDTTPRRVTRSHVVDNDENSHDSNTSVRSSSRLKSNGSVLKAANFKA